MLISQTRAKWPDCKIVAVVSSYAFRNSAVFEMGLWQPDQLLLKPLAPRLLSATVTFLWAQLRSEEIRQLVHETRFLLPGETEAKAPELVPAPAWEREDAKRSA